MTEQPAPDFRVGDIVTIGKGRNQWRITSLETWTNRRDPVTDKPRPDLDVAYMRSTMSRRSTCKPLTSLLLVRGGGARR